MNYYRDIDKVVRSDLMISISDFSPMPLFFLNITVLNDTLYIYLFQYAALFWYNYTPDGKPDPRTKHGGCPVLYGQKWGMLT